MGSGVLKAQAVVHVGLGQARQWFLDLKAHPERYAFATHAGFAFAQGDFGQVGAYFQTCERFYGCKLALHFELTEVGERRFCFRLIRPPLPIWGAFAIAELDDRTVELCLEIGGLTRLGGWFLHCPPVGSAIQGQIRGEVEHIRASMESIYAGKRA